jgi:hypothetical protein
MSPSGPLLLEVCRGLWALHGLTEKKATEAIAMLDNDMKSEMETIEGALEARLSVAGAASGSVRQMNDNARQEFQLNCGCRRQNLLVAIAWQFRQLLSVQQQILSKMMVPGFEDGLTVDGGALDLQSRVCSYLHSAFFLRNRVGEEPHVNMLKSHLKSLQKEWENPTTNLVPPGYAVPQGLPPLPPTYASIMPQLPPPPQYYEQGQMQQPAMFVQSMPQPPLPGGPYVNQQQYTPYYQ